MGRARVWQGLGKLVSLLSGEFLLRYTTNGGTVVVIRAAWTAVIIFCVALVVSETLRSDATLSPDAERAAFLVREHLHWLGAIFAATYAALYARFASQWIYLAGLYNQIMSAQARNPKNDGEEFENKERRRVYANWMAGFIEDADNLHLALKPIYASLIQELLNKADVRTAYTENTAGGKHRLPILQEEVAAVVAWEDSRQQRRYERWRKKRTRPDNNDG